MQHIPHQTIGQPTLQALVIKRGELRHSERHSPWRVALVGERQIAHAQIVQRPQYAHAAAETVAALHAQQAGNATTPKFLEDFCHERRGNSS